jgi:hypothetical protein
LKFPLIFRRIQGISTKDLYHFYPVIQEFMTERNDTATDRKDAETLELKRKKLIASSDQKNMVIFQQFFKYFSGKRSQLHLRSIC